MIASIAHAHGAHWEPTLTGFKWIANRALQLERERGLRFVFGFEEALGYCPGAWVSDKDGIASGVLAARLAAQQKARGRSLHDALAELFRRHGAFVSGQLALRIERQTQQRLMRSARAAPPDALAGAAVTAVLDLLDGSALGAPSFAPALPASDVLIWELAGGHRICIRPSGTEPKLKLYVDVREPVHGQEPVAAALARADAALATLIAALRERFAATLVDSGPAV
jgi:phosphomannomutase